MSCTNSKSFNPNKWNWKLKSPKNSFLIPSIPQQVIGTHKTSGKSVTFNRTNRGGSGSFGSVYVYSGKQDGKTVEVAVKTFYKKGEDDEFKVLKYIKNKNLDICETCPSVVCLDSFGDHAVLEALSHHLTFKDIHSYVDKNKKVGSPVNLSTLKFKPLLKKYIVNIIDGALCLKKQNLIYFDFNPKNIMVKDCQNSKSTEAVLVDIGAASVFSNGKFSVKEVPTSYPPISVKLDKNGNVEDYGPDGKDWYGVIKPTLVKGLKSLLTFITMLLFLSLNVTFEGNYAQDEKVKLKYGDADLNNTMAMHMPFRFKDDFKEYYSKTQQLNALALFETLRTVDEHIYKFITLGLASKSEKEIVGYIEKLRDYLSKGQSIAKPVAKPVSKPVAKPVSKPKQKSQMDCPAGQIRNPKTGRCVSKSGKIGKMLLLGRKTSKLKKSVYKSKQVVKSRGRCPVGKVRNPKSGRCVKKSGKIGKNL
jgi:hypothetical protein